jgi:uncharacterized protein (DUF4415 family)
MAEPPRRRSSRDPREAAEAAFRALRTPPKGPDEQRTAVPGVREPVTLRVDREVLDFFQGDGPGWQERMVETLRQAAGVGGATGTIPIDKLNASNDE